MCRIPPGPLSGLAAVAILLGLLATFVGLGSLAWTVGLGSALITTLLLSRSMVRRHCERLGPANRVTLTRAVLACLVAALVAESYVATVPATVLASVATVGWLLDGVDGAVAHRWGTVTALGARFDMEIDAFLILALSVGVAPIMGSWVLLIGAAHYGLLVARLVLAWLRAPLPPRYWAKVVAATQGGVLIVAASGLAPRGWVVIALVVALLLLVESFGREIWQLWMASRAAMPGEDPAKWPAERE